jgi:hypothetical protein
MPVILAYWKAEIRKIEFQSQPRQKISKTPTSANKLRVVAYVCNPSYLGGIGMRIVVLPHHQAKIPDPIQKNN